MRKFLSLVLALVMMMSLVTINAGAKEFGDADDITYDEAVDVISTIHVVDGYTDGSFKPGNNLSRGAAAKIICNMILGPTTAAELHADTAPYRDVPITSEFAGYIAYCQKEGIISGYADGSFRPAGTLTGYAFMKMLLGALGYDSEIEQYTGPNWSINVAKRAIGIGLNKGLEGTFNGVNYVTREEAALYAFNTLQADLVKYDQKITANVNGAEVTVGNSLAESRKWDSQATRINYIREDDIIQFAEEYFNKLEKRHGEDIFMRPAYTWIYDREEIGTYVDWEVMVEEYTTGVTGRDVYDLIGSTVLNDRSFSFAYYVDGVKWDDLPVEAKLYCNAGADIDRYTELTRSYQTDLGITANGVLTQVFLDKDRKEITITSINTWLAQATGDYQEAKEYAPMDVYYSSTPEAPNAVPATTYTANTRSFNADLERVTEVEEVKDEDWRLVRISYKEEKLGEIVEMYEPEIMDESTVTKFTRHNNFVVDKLTTNGTEYKHAIRAYYSDEALEEYDKTLLSDKSYNIFMDLYGYFIGVELDEGVKNYVFISSFDRPNSNNTVGTATAIGILLDGTMQEMKVNVKATNENIEDVRHDKNDGWQYFYSWSDDRLPGDEGSYRLNRWFTYSVNNNGVYTLTPATRMVAHRYTDAAESSNLGQELNGKVYDYIAANNAKTIKTGTVALQDNIIQDGAYPYTMNASALAPGSSSGSDSLADAYQLENPVYFGTRAYGNDASVYITVEMGDSDGDQYSEHTISDVTGVYTGVQDVEIEFDVGNDNVMNAEEAQIYAVYDKKGYIIGAVTLGEVKGGNANIAYILSGIKSERIEDGIYYWEFDAVLNGEKQTLTGKSNYSNFATPVTRESTYVNGTKSVSSRAGDLNLYDGLVELRIDSNGYVTDIKDVVEADIFSQYADGRGGNPGSSGRADGAATYNDMSEYKAYRMNVLSEDLAGGATWNSGANYYDSAPDTLVLSGRTLYITANRADGGLALTSDAKAVTVQWENGDWEKTQFNSVSAAISHLADADEITTGFQYDGEIVAKLNSAGAAEWVVFTNHTPLTVGSGSGTIRNELVGIRATAAAGAISVTFNGLDLGDRVTVSLTDVTTYNTYLVERKTITLAGTQNPPIIVNGESVPVTTVANVFTGVNPGRYLVECGEFSWTVNVT